MKFTMWIAEDFRQTVREVNEWLSEKEDGGHRVPKAINTNVCNMSPIPMQGLPTLTSKQVLVYSIFYEIEYDQENNN